MSLFYRIKKIKDEILGTSLQHKTKVLLINIAIGLILITGTCVSSLIGLKYDYDSSFLNQERKLRQLIVIQNIYSSILAELLKQGSVSQKINHLKKSWQDFSSIKQTSNYGTRFKELYAKMFLHDYSKQIQELSQSEKEISNIINTKLLDRSQSNFEHFQTIALSLNHLLHKAIQLRIEILNLNKNATDSLFVTSIFIISGLIAIIILTTLYFSRIIISSIEELHTSLEKVVFQKTRELRELNNDLKQKIAQELKESRKKDHIMYQQSRLASIGEMIQNIAHQWRQPLNSLTLIIQGFKLKYDQNKLSQEFINSQTQSALRIAKNMSNTIENFRNFFQPNSAREYFNIKKSIDDSLSILEANLKNSNISVHVFINENIVLFGYENAFTQVILNLINNAKDAITGEKINHGVIEICVNSKEENLILEIKDNAGGIKVKEIEKIFEPYFTTKHKSVGTGVGLYMVKQIIEKQLSGKIGVQNQDWMSKISQEKYMGASFRIILPLNLVTSEE